MNIQECLELVLDLARQAALDVDTCDGEEDLMNEMRRQGAAIDAVDTLSRALADTPLFEGDDLP